jgi:hypothetical protein
MGFHNPVQTQPDAIRCAQAATPLWIKTAKEDGPEIPQPLWRLVGA